MGGRERLIFASLLAVAPVAAIDVGIVSQSMGTFWNLVGSLFSFDAIVSDPTIRVGILKFLIFILLLRVIQVVCYKFVPAFQKDHKTSVVVGGVIAAITVLFTPNTFIFSSVIAIAVPLGIIGGITYMAFAKCKGSAPLHLLGAGLMLTAALLTQFMIDLYGKYQQIEPEFMRPFVMSMLELMYLICLVLLIAKLVMALFGGEAPVWKPSSKAPPAVQQLEDQNRQAATTPAAERNERTSAAEDPEHERDEPAAPTPPSADTDGVIEGIAVAIPPTMRGQPAAGATVWVERRGELLGRTTANEEGRFRLTLPIPKDELLVHASLDGFQEGIHINKRLQGRPVTLISLTRDQPKVSNVIVPLLFNEPVDPTPFDPKRAVVEKTPLPDPKNIKDTPFTPPKPTVDGDHRFIDLSPGFLPVEDQGPYGACTAFTIGGMMEYLLNSQRGEVSQAHQLSKMHLWIGTRIMNGTDPADWGSYIFNVCEHAKEVGVPRELLWPYASDRLKPPGPLDIHYRQWLMAEEDARNQAVTEHNIIDISLLVDTLFAGYPIGIGIPVYDNFFTYKGGTLKGTQGSLAGYHAVTIVGYDSHRPTGEGSTAPAYKLRNSWGTTWGVMGYVWVDERTLIDLLRERGGQHRILRGPRVKPDALATGTVTGRVIMDEKDPHFAEATGEDLYKQQLPTLPMTEGPIEIIAVAQHKGSLVHVCEPVRPDKEGRFVLKIQYPLPLEPLMKLPSGWIEAWGVDPKEAGAGILVAATHPQDHHGLSLHSVATTHSQLGRGGLGAQDRRNPRAQGAFSGVLINFSEQHQEENYVIIPLIITGSHTQVQELRQRISAKLHPDIPKLRKAVEEIHLDPETSYHWQQQALTPIRNAIQQSRAQLEGVHEDLPKYLELLKQERGQEKFLELTNHLLQKLAFLHQWITKLDDAIAKQNHDLIAQLAKEMHAAELKRITLELLEMLEFVTQAIKQSH